MNLGLSDKLKEFFPDVVANKIRTTFLIGDLDPYWVAGFTSGDGSFHVKISSSTTTKLGIRVQLRFSIGLNIREKELIVALAKFFNLYDFDRYIYISSNSVGLQITNISDILDIIIPFFEKYSIQGLKKLDFLDFKTVGNLMLQKEHLTLTGLDNILKIKASMNRNRLLS